MCLLFLGGLGNRGFNFMKYEKGVFDEFKEMSAGELIIGFTYCCAAITSFWFITSALFIFL